MPAGPLPGIRVIVLGQVAADPFASSRFTDLVVRVVKIARPNGVGGMRQ